jgi:hypothetical protein
MRLTILVFALLSTAASAQAGSIDVIGTGDGSTRSIEKITCTGCVARVAKKAEPVLQLAPGTQTFEIREVNGVKKLYRTEAWLGGSPVVHVSKAHFPVEPAVAVTEPVVVPESVVVPASVAAAPEGVIEQPLGPNQADMIDETSTTSAVTADTGADAKVTRPRSRTPAARAIPRCGPV